MSNIVYMAKSAWTNLLDTIRSKAGVSASMTVSQAATAVNNIPTGGGGDEFERLIERSISGSVTGTISKVGMYAFYSCISLTGVSFPSASIIQERAFFYCTKLKYADMQSVRDVGAYAFTSCSSLSTVNMPSISTIGTSAFQSCYSLKYMELPSLVRMSSYAFANCNNLEKAIFPNCVDMWAYAFNNCYKLNEVQVRVSQIYSRAFANCHCLLSLYLLGSSVAQILSTISQTFLSTPIYNYTTSTGGEYGTVYVPSSLYDAYISAAQWSTISSRIASIPE